MKKIKVLKWEVKVNDVVGEDNNINLIDIMMSIGIKESKLQGFENIRKINRISNSINDAEKSGFIELEDSDYDLIKDFINKYAPANFGKNKDIVNAINEFMKIGEKI